jgi:hypothetical protein
MQDLKYIKSFRFGYARYHLENGKGLKAFLKVDYWNDRFEIVFKGEETDELFRSEIEEIARGLLSRKHGVNFATKIE